MFWYHDEVEQLARKEILPKGEKMRVLFYGSSSIRLWSTLAEDFPEFEIINQGFGGSTLAACCWFFNKLIPAYKPDAIVLYSGDNDLGDGRHPEEVYLFLQNMMEHIKESCGNIPVGIISIKPSFNREHLINSIHYTNKIFKNLLDEKYSNGTLINVFDEMLEINKSSRELYEEDGLHLTDAGYQLWKRAVRDQFLQQFVASSKDSSTKM
ncbi:GDSL-type esterase/lipase family protein [Neptunitalea lumnitzerae]|uniref:SGNH hydrolase-type esterase domain-containing protein n=1 Tax=Neptunitalea lumnitzerae TaxID=2965509 RepID=A0ABQ5MLS2_9FLAO|nr:GDSL-type esterase/lipase family protein [Neptunitalea sp. Y10]GLB50302.1 hypothetical protein Y10_26700 [Neptunitalea sp. Y10]